MSEYDEDRAIAEVAEALRPTLTTDRLRLDQAAVEDQVRIVRGVLRAFGIAGDRARLDAGRLS